MLIHDEEYRKEFMFLNCRFKDGKWFFCRNVMQYYCRSVDGMGQLSPWTKVDGKFYLEEELTVKILQGEKVYLRK